MFCINAAAAFHIFICHAVVSLYPGLKLQSSAVPDENFLFQKNPINIECLPPLLREKKKERCLPKRAALRSITQRRPTVLFPSRIAHRDVKHPFYWWGDFIIHADLHIIGGPHGWSNGLEWDMSLCPSVQLCHTITHTLLWCTDAHR